MNMMGPCLYRNTVGVIVGTQQHRAHRSGQLSRWYTGNREVVARGACPVCPPAPLPAKVQSTYHLAIVRGPILCSTSQRGARHITFFERGFTRSTTCQQPAKRSVRQMAY